MVRQACRLAPFYAVLFLLFLVLVAPALSRTDDVVNGQGLLWRIESTGSAPSYLFGSVHVTDERVHDLPAPVADAFAGATSAAFELILDPDTETRFAQAMFLTDGRTLDQVVSPNLFRKAEAVGRKYGVPGQALQRFKPWAAATVFSMPPAEVMRLSQGGQPLDQHLQNVARGQGKRLAALETVDEQIALFDGIPERDQIVLLDSTVTYHAAIEQLFETIIQAYLARDTGALQRMMIEQSVGLDPSLIERFTERFLDVRNERMVARMASLLAEGNAFVVVGALHLPGERGMLRLLEQQGYRVSPVY